MSELDNELSANVELKWLTGLDQRRRLNEHLRWAARSFWAAVHPLSVWRALVCGWLCSSVMWESSGSRYSGHIITPIFVNENSIISLAQASFAFLSHLCVLISNKDRHDVSADRKRSFRDNRGRRKSKENVLGLPLALPNKLFRRYRSSGSLFWPAETGESHSFGIDRCLFGALPSLTM